MLLTPANLDAMSDGFNTLFNQALEGAPSLVDEIAMTVPSTGRTENYGWMGAFPGLREWIGPRHIKNLAAHSWTIANRDFEATIAVHRNDIEDDSYGIYAPMFSELGRSAKQHPDSLLFALMVAGFTTGCYDGQPFFDTDHPVKVPGSDNEFASVANTDGGAGAPWFLLDTSRAIRPFIWQKRREYQLVRKDDPKDDRVFFNKQLIYGVDGRCNVGVGLWQLAWGSKQTLDATHYKAARAAMAAFKDDEGKPLGVRPTTLICGTANEEAGLKLLNSEYGEGGESNPWKGTAKLIVTPYLD